MSKQSTNDSYANTFPYERQSLALRRELVTVSSAELLALFTTPKTIVAAPGTSFAVFPVRAKIFKPAGTAYASVQDLSFKYTGAAGAEVLKITGAGFLDQATAQVRFGLPNFTVAMTPVANAVMTLHSLTGNPTTGTSVLQVEFFYTLVRVVAA